LQGCLCVSNIHEVLSLVHKAFADERTDLEAEIALLQTTMDTESEVISRGNTPRGDRISDSFGCHSLQHNPTGDDLHLTSPPRGTHLSPSSSSFSSSGTGAGAGAGRGCVSKVLAESASTPVHKSVVVIGPGRIRRSTKDPSASATSKPPKGLHSGLSSSTHLPQSMSLSLKLSELAVNINANDGTTPAPSVQDGPSPTTTSRNNSGGGSNRSRMRSRIETARDERFFMDDDIFMR
jgi:hypothetical protein